MLLQIFALSSLARSPSRLPASRAPLVLLRFSLASNRSRKNDCRQESGLQNQDSKSWSINAISFQNFLTHFLFFPFFLFFFFWKEDKIDFLSNLSSLKLSHSDWHFPLVLPLTKTMTACHRLNAECQHFISEKAMLFLQELVFLMEPAYGPFNRKLKRLQNTIYQPFNQAVAIFFFFVPSRE